MKGDCFELDLVATEVDLDPVLCDYSVLCPISVSINSELRWLPARKWRSCMIAVTAAAAMTTNVPTATALLRIDLQGHSVPPVANLIYHPRDVSQG